MRGKGTGLVFNTRDIGITPAYAGKRENGSSGEPRKQDHPRLCGEKTNTANAIPENLRITPAYAGKSSTILFFTNCL